MGVWSLNTKLRQLEAFFGKIVGVLLWILSVLIYSGPQTDNHSKSYEHLKFTSHICYLILSVILSIILSIILSVILFVILSVILFVIISVIQIKSNMLSKSNQIKICYPNLICYPNQIQVVIQIKSNLLSKSNLNPNQV